jgi:phosphoribosyl-ATP pyrophosphohydrolase/phosphoribosyl-AMP cyclohydrolase/histidinol dehydrogenase
LKPEFEPGAAQANEPRPSLEGPAAPDVLREAPLAIPRIGDRSAGLQPAGLRSAGGPSADRSQLGVAPDSESPLGAPSLGGASAGGLSAVSAPFSDLPRPVASSRASSALAGQLLPERSAEELLARTPSGIDAATEARAGALIEQIRLRGLAGLRESAEGLGDLEPGAPLFLERPQLEAALADLPAGERGLLERTAERIRAFAQAQLACLRPLDVPVPGGRAGHRLVPLESAGCYAPGGRYPLPSSVLMTALVARTAGVERVVVASPRPSALVQAAAAVAGADRLLAVGGAQAIAALALGVEGFEPVDFIAGPGNRYVTAAKRQLFGRVGIDSLAGPSELLVIADGSVAPRRIALDLLAQAEHDPDAWPVLIALPGCSLDAVRAELETELAAARRLGARSAACADIAARSLGAGAALEVADAAQAARLADRLACEHLALFVADPGALAGRIRHAGALFLGPQSSEVFGDYGLGPNHVLPTGRGARQRGGLSVFDFLRIQTFLDLTPPESSRSTDPDAALDRQPKAGPSNLALADAAELADLEGLHFHAAAARARC